MKETYADLLVKLLSQLAPHGISGLPAGFVPRDMVTGRRRING